MPNTILIDDNHYPVKLRNVFKPPKKLFYKGNIDLLNEKYNSIAVIGARKPSIYGINCSNKFVEKLSKNDFVIVSGLAYGIDTSAHKECLKNKGKTIAVLAHGFDQVYPKSNKLLLNEILDNDGLIITEYEDGTKILPYMFLERSRIITGITNATLVIEAKNKSGSLSAAYTAFNQNRNVYAIPGDINKEMSFGTNMLIAKNISPLVYSPDQILEDFGIHSVNIDSEKELLSDVENEAIKELKSENLTAEVLSKKLNMLLSQTVSMISSLELKGLIIRNPDFTYNVKT